MVQHIFSQDKVKGQPLMLRPPDGPPQPYRSGVDGIAISHDGARLFYSALMGRRLFSVSSDALVNRALDDSTVATTIVDEGEKGGGGDGMESDAENGTYGICSNCGQPIPEKRLEAIPWATLCVTCESKLGSEG